MNIAHLGIVTGAAAGPLAQARSSEADRTQQDVAVHRREVDATAQAEAAAGIGTTNEDEAAGDRDADGRRPWEIGPQEENQIDESAVSESVEARAKDPSGQAGSQLDLSG